MRKRLHFRLFLGLAAFVFMMAAIALPFSGSTARAGAPSPGSNTFPTTGPDALYQIDESGWSGDSQTSDAVNGWGDDQWEITLSASRSVSIQVVDCCIVGDNYEVYVDSQLIGTTPTEPLFGSTLSQGTFSVVLTAGSHLITIRDPGAIFYYQQGNTFMIPAGYSVTITTGGFTDCPTTGTLGVTLPPVNVPVALRLKPWSIEYAPLPLTFTPEATPAASSVCTLDSNDGHLPILLDLPGGLSFFVGTSSAIVTLDFMGSGFDGSSVPRCLWLPFGTHNNCFLNTPGSHPAIARWHTSGFRVSTGSSAPSNTGPLTFYVDVTGLTGSNLSIPSVIQPLETFLHTSLISHLPYISLATLIQEPPNDVLVKDSSGNLSGRLPNGQIVTNIPNSLYIPATATSGAAVLIVNSPPAAYSVEVVGTPGASFSLVVSNADFTADGLSPTVTEGDQQGVLGPSGVQASCFSTDASVHCIGVDINPGSNATNLINPKTDATVKVALLADSQVSAANIDQTSIRFGANGTEASALQCHQEDVNHDGLPDLVCTFKVAQGGFVPGDWFGVVNAQTKDGRSLTGSDAVRVSGSL